MWMYDQQTLTSLSLGQPKRQSKTDTGNSVIFHDRVRLVRALGGLRLRDRVRLTVEFFMTMWTHDQQTVRLVRALGSLKPILNWANVCSPEYTSDTSTNYDSFLNWTFSSPNMVRTVQTLLHSQLACNEMQASARTCGRRAADSMIQNEVKWIYFHHPSQGNSTNYYLILGLQDKACASHKSTNKQISSEASEEPRDTVIHFYFCFFFIHRRALLSTNQRQWSMNRANVPRTCWAKLFEPRI